MSDEMQLPMLPQDVIHDILSRLPVKPLVRFRCVCRWWNSLIRDPTFIKLHLDRTILDIEETRRWRFLLSAVRTFRSLKIEHVDFIDDPDQNDSILSIDSPPPPPPVSAYNGCVHVVGSCNGLLCLIQRQNHYILWNPSTGECRNNLAIAPKVHLNDICHGFGYDSTMDDYKILRVTFAVERKIWILNVGSNFWRVFELKDQSLTRGLFNGDATFAYGSLHWASSQIQVSSALGRENRILSFSLVEEKFEEKIPPPKLHAQEHLSLLSVVGGKLSVLTLSNSNVTCDFDIWVMMEYGVKESWEKKVTISYDKMPEFWRFLQPLHFLRNGKVFVALRKDVMIYDPKTRTFQKVDVRGNISCLMPPLYIETLVSPFSVPSAETNTKLYRTKVGRSLKDMLNTLFDIEDPISLFSTSLLNHFWSKVLRTSTISHASF